MVSAALSSTLPASAAVPPVVVINDPLLQSAGSWGQSRPDQWGLYQIGLYRDGGQPLSRYPLQLEPVRVALIDSGLDYTHPDLGIEPLWRNPDEKPNGRDDDGNGYIDDLIGWNFVDNNNNPWDDQGHGTHVAGIISARRDNGIGISGIAPNARLMVLKVVDASGHAAGPDIAAALRYAVDKGAQLIQLSLGGAEPGPEELDALRYALEREAVVVIAAGNRASGDLSLGYERLTGPLVVGAATPQGERAPFSDWGPALDLLAPGVDILSLRARGSDFLRTIGAPDYQPGSAVVQQDYYRATGTSFAAPFVTGVAALILGRDPWLEPPQLQRMLLQSAADRGPTGIDQLSGYGLLDADAALVASPQRFVDARLLSVQVSRERQLELLGVADADRFARAELSYGLGEAPPNWQLIDTLTQPSDSGVIARVDPATLPKGRTLTLRLQVWHQDGTRRESWLQLALPGASQ
nr:S8 family peptidase [Motiliproteus sediminis]